MSRHRIIHGDSRDVLARMKENCVDAIVTDPPYELGFMAKRWDATGVSFDPEFWSLCLRVLKPGGHLLSFGGTRTWHRIAVAIEDAGFELRDTVMWVYGSGFPKSLDVSKAIDKAAGAEREIVAHRRGTTKTFNVGARQTIKNRDPVTAPATHGAQRWDGWGTALKPAYEPIILVRKPLDGTVAENVLKWGTGALNIGETRIGMGVEYDPTKRQHQSASTSGMRGIGRGGYRSDHEQPLFNAKGRWPANLALDEEAAGMLDESRFFFTAQFSQDELLLCQAKAIMEAWNPDLANTVDNSSCLPSEAVVSALNDAVTLASHGAIRLNDCQVPSMGATPGGLRRLCENAIILILSTEPKSLPASFRIDTVPSKGSRAKSAARKKPTDTTMTIPSPTSFDGCAVVVTLGTIGSSAEVGVADSATRFKYCAKASRLERELGLMKLPPGLSAAIEHHGEGASGLESPRAGSGRGAKGMSIRNTHPTVKPIDLMRWLVRLVAPPGGVVLDPFVGSGATVVAAKIEGFSALGIDQDERYCDIARAALKVPLVRRMQKMAEAARRGAREAKGMRSTPLFGR